MCFKIRIKDSNKDLNKNLNKNLNKDLNKYSNNKDDNIDEIKCEICFISVEELLMSINNNNEINYLLDCSKCSYKICYKCINDIYNNNNDKCPYCNTVESYNL